MVSVLDQVRQQLGPPSILINNAGLHGEFTLIRDSDPLRWRDTLLTNLYAPYLLCRLCAPAMIAGGWGRIVNVSSASGLYEPQGINSSYGLSKYALNFFTRQMAQELEGTNVTSTAIHPGEVQTEMWAKIKADAQSRGPEALGGSEWAAMVEKTGGDPPDKAADLILRVLQADPAEVNGKFLWIEEGIQTPRATW
jgi:NAD(P)-dependent dehydrogenase (short-subunit alcohol dehydrogenase family)